jgi:hypothetical protein
MLEIKIHCGTCTPVETTIDLEKFGVRNETDGKKEAEALHMLISCMNDRNFIDDGHRNYDAVNTSIALHVLGFNPSKWFKSFFDFTEEEFPEMFFDSDIDKFKEHLDRVDCYLESWGPIGKESEALSYAL